ncbi:delta and Notch-like epidermal growth factor-related receptor isoform X2 [Dendronephthya gigantea]|uniref:delta and Notch-like epidermal growth factor-related receptor isoform X2 n=1 Tax=Dendronephthya gigantea TaxID=151771 RepID=UPI00106C41E7|nr:delta and Notch-like epidermal growth factor-related receptor isoform X2 [Dendronephthya gigantea]
MVARSLSLFVALLATIAEGSASMFKSQPQFSMTVDNNKAFDQSFSLGKYMIVNGGIAECLEHCLEDCRCQSFQVCQNTQCQLFSSHKDENSSLLHEEKGCVYVTYQMRDLVQTFQNDDDQCSGISCYMKYNCCQKSDICPGNKTCQPTFVPSWKRFTCECPDGYFGDNCDEKTISCFDWPITTL